MMSQRKRAKQQPTNQHARPLSTAREEYQQKRQQEETAKGVRQPSPGAVIQAAPITQKCVGRYGAQSCPGVSPRLPREGIERQPGREWRQQIEQHAEDLVGCDASEQADFGDEDMRTVGIVQRYRIVGRPGGQTTGGDGGAGEQRMKAGVPSLRNGMYRKRNRGNSRRYAKNRQQ